MNEKSGWEPTLDENETPWMTAGAAIAALVVGAWALLALAAGTAGWLVRCLLV